MGPREGVRKERYGEPGVKEGNGSLRVIGDIENDEFPVKSRSGSSNNFYVSDFRRGSGRVRFRLRIVLGTY